MSFDLDNCLSSLVRSFTEYDLKKDLLLAGFYYEIDRHWITEGYVWFVNGTDGYYLINSSDIHYSDLARYIKRKIIED